MRLTNQFGSFYQLRKWYRKTFSGCSSGREFSGIRGDREPERLSLFLSLFLYAGHSPTALRHAMLLSTKSVLTTRIYLLASFYLVLVRTVVCSMESRERKKKEIFKPLSAWRWILSWQRATSTRIGRFCKLRFPWKSNDLLPSFRARKIRNSIACKFSSAIYFYSLSVTYLLIFARKRIAVYRKVNDRVLYGAVLHSKQWRHDAENRRQWKFNRKKAALFLRTWRRWLIRDRSNTSKVLMFCGIVRFIS